MKYLFPVFISLLLSCTSPSNSLHQSVLLQEVHIDGVISTKAYYNLNHLLSKYVSYSNGTIYDSVSFYYNASNLMICQKYDGFIDSLYYTNNQLQTLRSHYHSTNKLWEYRYYYDSLNRVIKTNNYYNDTLIGYCIYGYDTLNDSISKITYRLDSLIWIACKLKTDNMKYPYLINPDHNLCDLNLDHNIIYSYYYNIMMSSPPPEYNSTFEYNEDGYPSKEYRTYKNSTNTQLIEYFYELHGPLTNRSS